MSRLAFRGSKGLATKSSEPLSGQPGVLPRLALAVLGPAIIVVVSLLFRSAFERFPFLLAWLPIAVATWYGGIPYGLFAAALSLVLLSFFFTEPVHALDLTPQFFAQMAALALSVVVAGLARNATLKVYGTLRASQRRAADILESLSDPFYGLDRDWRFTYVNHAAERLWGGARAELAGAGLWAHAGGSIDAEARAVMERAMRERQPARFETFDAAQQTWMEMNLYPTDEGLSVYVRDITARKQAEQALRASEQRWATTLSSIGDAVIATDTSGRITFMNAQAEGLTGWPAGEAAHRPVADVFNIINEDTRVRVVSPVEQVLASGLIVGLANHTLLVRKDGTEVPIDDSGAPIRDEQGRTTGVVLVFRDFSDQKRAVMERERLLQAEMAARREAERQSELRMRFLGMISHELRTPLQSIKGFATTLLAKDVTWDEDNRREFYGIIDQEADKLTDMIDQILDLTRIESGRLSMDPQPQSIEDILAGAEASLRVITARHAFTLHVPGGLPRVRADGRRVTQVMANLVENAVKYSPPGTPITLCVESQGGQVRVCVSDQGPGIAPEDRASVFEAFRRGDGDSARHTKGAGLGLAICKGIIEAHGGRIWIEDRDGPGTSVSFTLPVGD